MVESIKKYLENVYNINVSILNRKVSIKEELLGWKNGNIILKDNFRIEEGTGFMICHIFGHLIQFQKYTKYKELLDIVHDQNSHLNPNIFSYKKEYFLYEQEAFMLGKEILKKSIDMTLLIEQKYEAFMYADFNLYWNYVVTNEINELIFDKTYYTKLEVIKQNNSQQLIQPIKTNSLINLNKLNHLEIIIK